MGHLVYDCPHQQVLAMAPSDELSTRYGRLKLFGFCHGFGAGFD